MSPLLHCHAHTTAISSSLWTVVLVLQCCIPLFSLQGIDGRFIAPRSGQTKNLLRTWLCSRANYDTHFALFVCGLIDLYAVLYITTSALKMRTVQRTALDVPATASYASSGFLFFTSAQCWRALGSRRWTL
jgi:hypothetical protein